EARKAYEKARRRQGENFSSPQKDPQEILKDILNDPFARRVFEDIYSHIRHDDRPRAAGPAKDGAVHSPGKGAKSKGAAFGGIRSWLRRQIDDEQILKLPGEQIVPGARVRLDISHGLYGEPQAIELTLPPEFIPGKAMRLKGMGRRLGAWRGDLYVRIEPA
ncbi:MAG: molecular chaperone DnaJ, partial [Deltaproteobacteria bacterium]|nr:molecular chaperone DnaJ [Deltaproteobacteria bacterium]